LDERAPNRAWLAPMIGLAHGGASTTAVTSFVFAALAALAILAAILALPDAAIEPALVRSAELAATANESRPERGALASDPAPTSFTYVPLEDRKLTGIIVDLSGAPVAGAEVVLTCRSDDVPAAPQVTRADGRFAFDVELACEWALTAIKGDTVA